MEDIKLVRAKLLAEFIGRHGGASHVLSKVMDPGSPEFKSRMSYATQCISGGFGEGAARKWEDLLHPVGMTPGYLEQPGSSDFPTSTVHPYSVKTSGLAPVFAWARLGDVLFTESESLKAGEYREKPDGAGPLFKWFTAEIDMPRLRIKRGWRVAVDPLTDASTCQDGETYLFKTAGGSYFLGDFRRLAVGYEAIPDSGPVMDTERHGITVVAEFAGAMK